MAISTGLNSSLLTAISGMNTAAKRVDVAASNIVGSSATDSLPLENEEYNGYTPLELETHSMANGGVTGVVTEKSPAYIEGLNSSSENTAYPNVDISEEIVNMSIAETTYKANIQTIKTIDNMSKKLVDIIS